MPQNIQHTTPDNTRDIQLSVHEIARTWLRRGLCPDCIIRQIIIGASVVAQDTRNWPADAVHEAVDDAFSADMSHIMHDQH